VLSAPLAMSPHLLTVPVTHKTGENTNVTHDMGMIYARSWTIVMVSLNTGVTGLMADADDRIGGLARLGSITSRPRGWLPA
jgi:hypothetical protein